MNWILPLAAALGASDPLPSWNEGKSKQAIAEILMSTHAGTTTTEFEAIVEEWIATLRHPTTKRSFTEPVCIHERIGRLEQGLVEAAARGWTVVDMKQEWKSVFPPEKK